MRQSRKKSTLLIYEASVNRSEVRDQKIRFICFQFFLERGIETMSSILIQ